jgi:hypothetical protein
MQHTGWAALPANFIRIEADIACIERAGRRCVRKSRAAVDYKK